jgi:hypothetical protein
MIGKNADRARSWCGMVLAGWLIAGAAGVSQAAFTGDFGPTNWAVYPGSVNPGSFYFSGTGDAMTLHITSSPTPGFSDTVLALQWPYSSEPGFLDFSFTLTRVGNVGEPLGYFYVGSVQYDLLGSDSLTDIEIPANTPVYFELLGDLTPGKNPAELQVALWTFVPEPSPALFCVLGLALAACLKRKAAPCSCPAAKAAALSPALARDKSMRKNKFVL